MTRLAKLIEEKRTNVRQLARDANVPERTVYRHVNGETDMRLVDAAAYARALQVTIEELVPAGVTL